MGAVSAVPVAVDALRRNTVILAGAGVGVALGVGHYGGFTIGWPEMAVGSLLVVLARPFVDGGLYGMAEGAISGRTRFATFLREGRRNYRPVLLATLLLLGIVLALALVGGVLLLGLVLAGLFAFGPAVFAAIILLQVSLVLVPVFFAQFYAAAIVVDGTGAVGGIRRSARLVRSNLLSTLGYTALVGAVNLLGGAPFVWYTWSAEPAASTPPEPPAVPVVDTLVPSPDQLPVVALYLALVVAISGFLATYHVAYYLDRTAAGAS